MSRKKVALLIGNNTYRRGDTLRCCVNDAHDVSNKLHSIGFEPTVETDVDFVTTTSAIDTFVNDIRPGDTVVFFFSGHGTQWGDQNFLVPVDDSKIQKREDLKTMAINAQSTLDKISGKNPSVILFLLDCCRNYYGGNEASVAGGGSGGSSASSSSDNGLTGMTAPFGSIIVFACAPGKSALDGSNNCRNSLFTTHLLTHIAEPNISIYCMLCDVTSDVWNKSGKRQLPYKVDSMTRSDVALSI
jgi:uncharacterized caspase-like protein